MEPARFVLHHAPHSRAFRALWLLEEAGAAYSLVHHDLSKGTQKAPAFLALNPGGKLPVLLDHGPAGDWSAVVCESAAICAYVADMLPAARLAPALDSPLRGAYATWLAYVPGALEPAMADLMFPRQSEPPSLALGWPRYDAALRRVEDALRQGPYLLGEDFSAADILTGSLLQWLQAWRKLPESAVFDRYLAALAGRDGLRRAQAVEAQLLQARADDAAHTAAAAGGHVGHSATTAA